jgi:hypothetical protein
VDFYHQTTKKMQEKDSDNVDVGKRLKDAEAAAKKAADAKGPKADVVLGDDAPGSAAKPKADVDGPHDTFDVEEEMKKIMKKAPSMFIPLSRIAPWHRQERHANVTNTADNCVSHHIFQIVLPLFEKGKGHPPRQVQDCPRSFCCRIGSSRSWLGDPRRTPEEDKSPERTQHSHQWKEHRRRR